MFLPSGIMRYNNPGSREWSWVFGVGLSEGPEPGRDGSSDPTIEAGAPSPLEEDAPGAKRSHTYEVGLTVKA